MAKKWVQISDSQAKFFEAFYTRTTERMLFTGLVAFLVCLIVVAPVWSIFSESFQSFLIRFIESKFFNGEPLSVTVKQQLLAILSVVLFIIQYIISFTLMWLFAESKDEFVFDLNKNTISYINQSNFDRLLRREGSVQVYSLANCSKVAVVIVADTDSDGDFWCYYSLEIIHSLPIIGNYPQKSRKNMQLDSNIKIESSGTYSSLEKLVRSEDITRFQNLARQIGNFLKLAIELEPSEYLKIKHEKGIQEKLPEKQNLPESETIESAVEKIYKTLISSFGQTHEYRLVNSEDFQGYVDLAYYHRLQSALVDQGYIWAGDIEDVTLLPELEQCNTRTFIRILINPTHNTSIGIYHLKPRIFLFLDFLLEAKVFDCETEFSPEKYLVTTNADKISLDYPPGFDVVHLPAKTSYKTVLKTHYQRLQRAMSNWGLFPTSLHSLDDVIAMQTRMQQAKMAYRQRIGYITDAELRRFQVDPQIAREVGRRLKEKFNSVA